MQAKLCKDCGETKPVSEFYPRADRKDRWLACCKTCSGMRAKNLASRTPEVRRDYHLRSRYNITLGDQERMLKEQDGCAICHTWSYGKRAWAIDHDHSCCSGRSSCGDCVRGVLCTQCNTMIAMAHDDIDTLLRAVDYLQANVKRTIPA